MSVITLTTDFGCADWFAGAAKGVILSLAPRATVIDLCHGVGAGNNAISNIPNDAADQGYQIVWCSRAAFPLKPCYQGTPPGRGVAVRGSAGFIEIAINGGSAAEHYKLKIGTSVTLRRFKAGQAL